MMWSRFAAAEDHSCLHQPHRTLSTSMIEKTIFVNELKYVSELTRTYWFLKFIWKLIKP